MKLHLVLLLAGISFVDIASRTLATAAPPDANAIQTGIQTIIQSMESAKQATPDAQDEFLVLAYSHAQDRPPTPAEFFTLRMLRAAEQLSNEQILLLVLQDDQGIVTWDQCRTFLEKTVTAGFISTPETHLLTNTLLKTPIDAILEELQADNVQKDDLQNTSNIIEEPLPDVQYNTYFGDLHNHSNLSHGMGSASEAYAYARDVAGLDFFSLSDHSELMIFWPWDHKWEQMRDVAETYNAPGQFVTLWGFEWSHPFMGHINVFNSEDTTNCIATMTLWGFYHWLQERPEAFGTFNHPGFFNYAIGEFRHFLITPAVVPQMVGIELFNTCMGFDFYYYQNRWGNDLPYIDMANTRGWRLGALGGDDNHFATWDTDCPYRTGVLATELTREAIIDAYRARRFYSTENLNLLLDFRCAGYPMGSHLRGIPRTFTLSAHDTSQTRLKAVSFYRNGERVETRAVNSSSVEIIFQDTASSGLDYYYGIVESSAGDHNGRHDEAISSPIWFDAEPVVPAPGCNAASGTTVNSLDFHAPVDGTICVAIPCILLTLLGWAARRKKSGKGLMPGLSH